MNRRYLSHLSPLKTIAAVTAALCLLATSACATVTPTLEPRMELPHEGRWGIYSLDLSTKRTDLVYSSDAEIFTSALRLDDRGERLAFAQKVDGKDDNAFEICSIRSDGTDFRQHTHNRLQDVYPAWSPNGTRILFLSMQEAGLDLYVIGVDESEASLFYDSGGHDADVDWKGDRIVFTSASRIWSIDQDGTSPFGVTEPPRAGEWGNANLPFGDYDPRLSPDGQRIVFERLVDDESTHGNYDIYAVNVDGTEETRLTDTGYSQGLAEWSHSGDRIVFTVAAMGDRGAYDLYVMDADGTSPANITPEYFPPDFLCHAGVFSADDSHILFIGEWYE